MFITFEGPEGGGKSTQIALLADYLRARGTAVVVTREPGGTPIGDQIRHCLHDVNNTAMTAETELLLYSASRAQMVAEVILPSLAEGKVVLSDRFADSTVAYQGYGRGLDPAMLRQINALATAGVTPDVTFLLDLPVEAGLGRRIDGGEEMNRLDRETIAFHQRVRAGYHALVAAEPARWRVVDATEPADRVQAALRTALVQWEQMAGKTAV